MKVHHELGFTMEDFGRFAKYADLHCGGFAGDLVFHWLCSFEDDKSKHRAIWDRVQVGYNEDLS